MGTSPAKRALRQAKDNPVEILVTLLLFAVVVGIAMFAVSYHAEPEVTNGVITAKNYDDPDSWYVSGYHIEGSTTCTGGYGSTPRSCSKSPDIDIPGHWEHDPAHWSLHLRDCETTIKTAKDGSHVVGKKCREGWHEVSEQEYGTYQVNQHYPKEGA